MNITKLLARIGMKAAMTSALKTIMKIQYVELTDTSLK